MRSPSAATISHFSHPHPLTLTNPKTSRICSACNQTLETEPLYTCTSPSCATTFSLHLKCSQLPQTITHPCHCHQLNLVFSSPYGKSAVSCDVCGVVDGSKCWLYRCGLCGFDAHLFCVTSKVHVEAGAGRSSIEQFERFVDQENNKRDQLLKARMAGAGVNMVQDGTSSTSEQFQKWCVDKVNNQNHMLLQAMTTGGGGGNMNNKLLQGMMGGGGGGGNMNTDQLLQRMMDANKYNNQLLQARMGGGDMNNQMLQAMMGGGNGGSSQLLQAMMGGGGASQDLSSVLGNFGGLMGAGLGGFGL